MNHSIPDFLTHYYEASKKPFLNLSDLPIDEAESILNQLRSQSGVFAGKRPFDYLQTRFALEDTLREKFVAKGGKPIRQRLII